jgi:signal peptidase I
MVIAKRVVGLPNETVQIRWGQLYVDGRIQRKTLAEQRSVTVLVHDADYPPAKSPPSSPRWYGAQPGTGWGECDGRFAHPGDIGNGEVDWLVYHHWIRVPGMERVHESAVSNDRGYNQFPSRHPDTVRVVPDLWMTFRVVRTYGDGEFLVRVSDGRDQFTLEIHSDKREYRVYRNGKRLGPPHEGAVSAWEPGVRMTVLLVDCQFLVALEDRSVVAVPFAWPTGPPPGTSRPLWIGSRSLGAEVEDLRVYRDTYFDRPPGPRARWGFERPVRLGKDEYFVLGDNSPISDDSRNWAAGPGVPWKLVVGKPFLVHLSGRRVGLLGGRFQVPDPREIRYIR